MTRPLLIAMDHVSRVGEHVVLRVVTVEDGEPYTLPFAMPLDAARDLARRLVKAAAA